MLIVLSMTMATQYATTKIGYTFNVVHPSDADIRFIGSDNSSDNIRILRINGTNASDSMALSVHFDGNISAGQNKTYTAVFGIVNEEIYKVNISYIDVTGINSAQDYMQVWLHGDRDQMAENDASSVLVFDKGSVQGNFANGSTVWQLGAGDHDPATMDGGNIATPWDDVAHVRWSEDETNAVNQTDDYVWVQISIDVPLDADESLVYSGTIFVFTRAATDE
jgi:hypothetical protein